MAKRNKKPSQMERRPYTVTDEQIERLKGISQQVRDGDFGDKAAALQPKYFTFTDIGICKGDLDFIRIEDSCQLMKWGNQTFTPDRWMLILTEEIGELSKAVLEARYGGDLADVHCEAVQCATLCLKIAVMAKEKDAESA